MCDELGAQDGADTGHAQDDLGVRMVVKPAFSPVTGAEALFIAAGVALPFLIQMRALLRCHRAHRGLAPLWRDLVAAAPDVVLSPGSRVRAAAVPIQLRLYRRVIEIRDAMIVLRSYITVAIAEQVRRHVTDHSVPGPLADTHITACWLTAACTSGVSARLPRLSR